MPEQHNRRGENRPSPSGDPALNIPVPDPSALTSEMMRDSIHGLRELLEVQIQTMRSELDAFRQGHEEKHVSVVGAAIAHRKELSDASIAVLRAQVDAQFSALSKMVDAQTDKCSVQFSAADLRYQQRYDAQTQALGAAFEAQQNATAAALASAKEAVQTALTSSEKAVSKAELATEKLIPRAEVEARINDLTRQFDAANSATDRRIEAFGDSLGALVSISDRLEKVTEAVVGLDRVTDAKFVTFRTLIDSQAEKVALALAASNKAVDAAFITSAAAVTKAENFAEKRFDIIVKQIDELKTYRDASTGKGAGAIQLWGLMAGGVGLLIAVTSIIIAFN